MWRTPHSRVTSAKHRLTLAKALWGWKPHAAQKDLFTSRAQVRVAACGRRWGKTESLAVDIATLAIDEARNGKDCRQLVVAPTDTQARLIGAETLALLRSARDGHAELLPGLDLKVTQRPGLSLTLRPIGADGKAPGGTKARGHGPPVSRILFRTAGRDGRGLRGLWAHRIVLDEAAYIPDGVITDVLLPMLTDVGGDLLLASSPAGRGNVFHRLFARGTHPLASQGPPGTGGPGGAIRRVPPTQDSLTCQSFQCPSTDNPHLNHDFLRAMQEELGEARYAVEYLAQFLDDYGAVFRQEDIDGCIAADPAVTLDNGNLVSAPIAGHCYSIGIDWGRRLDFTVAAVLDGTTRPARLVGLWRMRGTGWEAQAARVGEIVAAFRPLRVLADGNGVGDPIAERLQQEIIRRIPDGERVPQVERFLFAGESKARLVDTLGCGLSARGLTYPAHRALLAELRGFEYCGETASGRHRMAAKGGGHDDIVMALALAWMRAPEGPPPSPSDVICLGSSLGIGRREWWD